MARTIKALAREAIDIQDASNLGGLVHGFSRMMAELQELSRGMGTDYINKHPIVTMWLDKLCDLNGRHNWEGSEGFSKAYSECRKLAEID